MEEKRYQTATLGGGCFWCVEAVFKRIRGVKNVVSGYAGGHVPEPDYRQVCSGMTGHAEVVQITFDPDVISFRQILQIFFATHDPTTLNRQGADVGTQYRSIILYHNEQQHRVAVDVIEELSAEGIWDAPIVTETAPLEVFYPAEADHQDYFERNPEQAYCQIVIAPKVSKLRSQFADMLIR